jgi:hypothetical protein
MSKLVIPSKKLKVSMKTCVASKVVLFQETFEYADAIIKHILSSTIIIIPSTCTKWLDLGHCICYLKKKFNSNEEINKSTIGSKLLFPCLMVSPKEVSLLLKWWKKQEARFL